MILTRGNWNYDISFTPRREGMVSWVVIRFPVGMTAAAGRPMAAGMGVSREEAEREAEDIRRSVMAADAGREVRRAKVAAIVRWLQRVYPGNPVTSFPEKEGREAQSFRVEGVPIGLLTVSNEFIDEWLSGSDDEIARTLAATRVLDRLRQVSKNVRVVVTGDRGIWEEPLA